MTVIINWGVLAYSAPINIDCPEKFNSFQEPFEGTRKFANSSAAAMR
jgi:hypothetical protein